MIQSIDISLFWWALVGFGAASLMYIVFLVSNVRATRTAAAALMGGSFAALTAAITMRTVRIGHLPVTNMFEYLSIFAWSAGLFYFIFVMFFGQRAVGAFVAPVVLIVLVGLIVIGFNYYVFGDDLSKAKAQDSLFAGSKGAKLGHSLSYFFSVARQIPVQTGPWPPILVSPS